MRGPLKDEYLRVRVLTRITEMMLSVTEI